MLFLIVNDDGIEAAGLAALVQAASSLGEIRVVAPHDAQSGSGHSMTDRTPLHVVPRRLPIAASAHAVHGKPADCTRLGLLHYAAGADWVLSGINHGGNLGVDIYYSGTVGAAREASILGAPAIALSQYVRDPSRLDWERAARWARHVIGALVALGPRAGLFWNVNLPQPEDDRPPEIVVAPLAVDAHAIRYHRDEHADEVSVFHYRGRYQDRPRPPGSDVDAVFSGAISVTPMGLEAPALEVPGLRLPPLPG